MAQVPTVLQGPQPVETADLHFKFVCKLKVFECDKKQERGHCNLLAASQYYGLIFIGNSNGFSVIQTKSVKPGVNSNEYRKKDFVLNCSTTHVTVDFTQKILGVVCSSKPGAKLYLYNISSLSSKNVTPLKEIPLGEIAQNLAAEVLEISWQPNADGTLMVCMSDGSILSLKPTSPKGSLCTLPSSTQAVCFCWSPKGKQAVIGCTNGSLSQYKPDLKLAKSLPAPPLFNGAVTIVGILWISSYQFAVAYNEKDNSTSLPLIAIVNAAQNKPVNFINYNEILFSSTFFRNHQMYMSHQNAWNLIFISSANSMEVAVLKSNDNLSWEQWLLGDASRAELPLNTNREETFPLGLAFDFTAQDGIAWGENFLPPMPRLFILSNEGILCVFNVVNLAANAPQLCKPPKEQLPDFLFAAKDVDSGAVASTLASAITCPAAESKQVQTNRPLGGQSSFDSSKPTFTFGQNFGGFSSQSQNTTPQLTVSVPGGGIVAGIKDIPVLQQQQPLQLQNQQQQQAKLLHQQQQQQQQANLQNHQQQQQAQQQQLIQQQNQQLWRPSQNVAVSDFQKSSGKPNSNVTFVFERTISFDTLAPSLSSDSKPVANQPSVVFATSSAPAATAVITLQGNVPKEKAHVVASGENPTKPVEINGKSISKPTKEKETASEVEGNSAVNSSPRLQDLTAVDDSVYWNALKDEIDHFNSELQVLSSRIRSLDVQVGSPEDKIDLRKRIDRLNDFLKEAKETTGIQSGEIHSVVTDLMESFACLEDAKSRNLQRKNPSFIELKKSEELDPISARHMKEIGHLKYYIENQLKQLSSHLEKEWMNHQDNYRTNVKSQMTVPTLEEVYKAMLYQLKILNKQRNLVEELKQKMAAKKRKNKLINPFALTSQSISSPFRTGTNRVSELSKLADNLLQLKIDRRENSTSVEIWENANTRLKTTGECSREKQTGLGDFVDDRTGISIRPVRTSLESNSFLQSMMNSQLKTISERSKKLTFEKQAALRDFLCERNIVRIRPMKASFESSFFLRSMTLGNSPQKMPPVTSETEAENPEKVSFAPVESTEIVASTKPCETEKMDVREKLTVKAVEVPKIKFGTAEVVQPVPSIQPPAETMQKSPLDSLSGIVLNVGKETNAKSKAVANGFVFSAPETAKESFKIASTESEPQQKYVEVKSTAEFTFDQPKSSESAKFEGKVNFDFGGLSNAGQPSAKPESVKETGTGSIVTTTVTTPSFGFMPTPASSAASSVGLTKMNFFFGEKEETSGSTATSSLVSGNLFPVSTVQTSTASAFVCSASSVFGAAKSMTSAVNNSVPVSSQPTSFVFSRASEDKSMPSAQISVIARKPETETGEIDVITVEEPKKTESASSSETSSNATSNAVGDEVSATSKAVPETAAAISPFASGSTNQSLPASKSSTNAGSIFGKASAVTSSETSTSISSTFGQVSTTTTAPSVFSLSAGSLNFGQATATTVATTAAAAATTTMTTTTESSVICQAVPSTCSIVEKASGTTPSANIFGGQTTTTNIFGASTSTSKALFEPSSDSSAPTGQSIFGSSIPTVATTVAAPTSTPLAFSDASTEMSDLFSKALPGGSGAGNCFAASPTASGTTRNVFNSPGNVFGGGGAAATATTSTSLFGGTSAPIFESSDFGRSATSSSNVFGQATASNSFFGQNICSPFDSSNQSTFESGGGFGSKPIFGQSLFGQRMNNTSVFGGSSSSSSIFDGASNSASTGSGNAFQTVATTTTTAFGSTPGPFSSSQGTVAETGFGASNAFQKPLGGFGSPPVFVGGPSASTFGSSFSFGGGPTFGSQATFESRPGIFDSSQGGFSQPQSSTTFENLANQNTVGFENLAQQSQSQGFGGFNSTPAFENKTNLGFRLHYVRR